MNRSPSDQLYHWVDGWRVYWGLWLCNKWERIVLKDEEQATSCSASRLFPFRQRNHSNGLTSIISQNEPIEYVWKILRIMIYSSLITTRNNSAAENITSSGVRENIHFLVHWYNYSCMCHIGFSTGNHIIFWNSFFPRNYI